MDLRLLSSSLRLAIAGLHKGLRRQSSSVNTYSMTEVETIGHLFRNPALLPSELAVLTRVKTQSMSQVLNKLEKHGVISRTPSAEDKRKVYISLTSAGQKMVEKVSYEKDEWLKHAIETSLTPDEMELLEKIIPILNKLLEVEK